MYMYIYMCIYNIQSYKICIATRHQILHNNVGLHNAYEPTLQSIVNLIC